MSAEDGPPLRIEVLGTVRAFRGGRELDLGPPRQRAVLAMLALRANRVVARDEIVDGGWGTDPPVSVVNRVHAHVAALRRLVEPDRARRAPGQVLASVGSGYRLALVPGHLDAEIFAARLDTARRLVAAGRATKALASFDAALELWRGTPLTGLPGPFAEAERVRLAELRLSAAEERAAVLLGLGPSGDLVSELSALVVENPLRERLRALLMIALYRAGRQAEALSVYADTRRHLVEELGVEPGPQLQRLHHDMLAGAEVGVDDVVAVPPGRAEVNWVVPRQLPPAARHFTGRLAELDTLTGLLDQAAGTGRAVVISAIDGTAGIGKTTLAVYWAHRVADRFPDGQLYVNLRGFDPTGSPVEPGTALRGFLDALGVAPQRIPAGIDAQAGLYRSLLADRRVLVVLDNAANVEHVRPLLPASPTALALVTSRNRLTGLVAAEGAVPLTLDLLSNADAHELLARHLGAGRVSRDPAAVDEIIARCARLPLALSILAARAATHPEFSLDALAAELDETRGGLDAFDTGDRAMDMRTVFSWSYRRLGPDAARLFRLLGLHPGPDIAVPAAASLAGVPANQARVQLAELARAHLVDEHAPGRYAMHDLLRTYAAELADGTESPPEREGAVHRVLDHYLYTAWTAAVRLHPHRIPLPLPPAQPGAAPETLGTVTEALAWFSAQHPILMAAIGVAAATGFDTHVWQLANSMTHFMERSGRWHDWETSQLAALAATRRLGDEGGQARTCRSLAGACARQGRYQEARAHLRSALDLFGRVGDLTHQATVHTDMAMVFGWEGNEEQALRHSEHGLEIHRSNGHRAGQAHALNAVGWHHARLGHYEQALEYCEQSLARHQELGDPHSAADTLDSLGFAHHHLGHFDEAAACYERALDLYRETGDRYNEAASFTRLGDAQQAAGDNAAARRSWERALTILDDLGHSDAGPLRDKLRHLDQVPSRGGAD